MTDNYSNDIRSLKTQLKHRRRDLAVAEEKCSKAATRSNLNGLLILGTIFASAVAAVELPQDKPLVGVFSVTALAPLALRSRRLNRKEEIEKYMLDVHQEHCTKIEEEITAYYQEKSQPTAKI